MEEQHPLLITNTASCFKGLTATAILSPDKEQFLTHTSKGVSLLAVNENPCWQEEMLATYMSA
jgi:hypothetical protein